MTFTTMAHCSIIFTLLRAASVCCIDITSLKIYWDNRDVEVIFSTQHIHKSLPNEVCVKEHGLYARIFYAVFFDVAIYSL